MKNVFKAIACFFLLHTSLLFSQNVTYKISGSIIDENRNPLSYAEVVLRKYVDSTMIDGSISNEEGIFSMDDINPGKYILSAHFLGFKTKKIDIEIKNADEEFFNITLEENNEKLEEIVLEGKKKLIRRELNKVILDVENSIFNKGENGYRLLNIVPAIQADGVGNIVFRGQEGVTILINGRKSGLEGNQLMNYLKSLPSESIKNIEFSSIASSEYDGNSGAIINIVLKDEYSFGFSGSIYSTFTQNRFSNYNNGLFLNYRKGKFNLQTNYVHLTGANFSDNIENQQNGSLFFTQNENYKNDYGYDLFKIGSDIYPFKNHSLIINYELSKFNTDTFGHANTAFKESIASNIIDSLSITTNSKILNQDKHTLNTYYRIKLDSLGSLIDFGYSYVKYDNSSDSKVKSRFFNNDDNESRPPSNNRINNPLEVGLNTFNLDWKMFFKNNSNIEAGIKYSFSITDNKIAFYDGEAPNEIINTSRSDNFIYSEKITGIYSSYRKKYDMLSFKFGLRTEYTDYLGNSLSSEEVDIYRNRWDFFPSIYTQYRFQNNNSINFSYGRRINRPSFSLLNPFEDIEDPFFSNRGNPELVPYFTNSYELTYNFKSKYSITLAHSSTKEIINNVYQINGDKIISTYENINDQKDYLISTNIPISITKWYNASIYSNLRYRKINVLDNQQTSNKLTPYFSFSNKLNFVKSGYYFELNGSYLGESFYSIYTVRSQGSINLNFKKTFLNDKLSLSLNTNDPFNWMRIKLVIDDPSFTRKILNRLPTRTFSFTVSYNFSSGKKNTSRENINPGNQEEINRLSQ
jgi:hypothetical protein